MALMATVQTAPRTDQSGVVQEFGEKQVSRDIRHYSEMEHCIEEIMIEMSS